VIGGGGMRTDELAWKVPGKTAIPSGMYKVVITPSARFKRPMPLLLNVPNFEGIRIHWGNTDADTEGCILVGRTQKPPDFIGESRLAFDALFPKIKAALDSGNTVTLSVGEAGT
jgi:hypothetical protein